MNYQSPESKKEEFRRCKSLLYSSYFCLLIIALLTSVGLLNFYLGDWIPDLKKSGAIDSLTASLVNLYEEPNQPEESTDYIQKHLGDGRHPPGSAIMKKHQQQLIENEKLKKENEKLKQKVNEMAKVIETLKANQATLRAEARKARHEQN